MDDAVRDYIAAIPAEYRPLFDRFHVIVTAECPDAGITLSYGMPTYKRGKRRLYLATWKHGVSIYGWGAGQDVGIVERHPELLHGKGTIRLGVENAADVGDDEFRALVRAVLVD